MNYNTPERANIPIRASPGARPAIKRHHSASYYAHRVKESLTTRISKFICAIFLSVILFLGIIAFILWLSLRPHRPRWHIEDFAMPGLGDANGFQNALISFNVTIRNPNQHIAVRYDSMEGSVFYKDERIGSTPLPSPFYQEPKNTRIVTTTLTGASLTVTSNRWQEFTSDRARGTVEFRLEIVSMIKFKLFTWNTHHHRMHANCRIVVGPDGVILAKFNHKRCPVYFT